jgi:hypothetical protein
VKRRTEVKGWTWVKSRSDHESGESEEVVVDLDREGREGQLRTVVI